MATKKQNRRNAKKRALRIKHRIHEEMATRDSTSAAKRVYGRGLSKDD